MDNKHTRLAGYYWVLENDSIGWEVAFWNADILTWEFCGTAEPFDNVIEIGKKVEL